MLQQSDVPKFSNFAPEVTNLTSQGSVKNADEAEQAGDAEKLYLSRWEFEGNTLIDDETLSAGLAGYSGRGLSFAELEAATRMVAAIYRDQGYVAKGNLPPQEVIDGVVKMQIIEALFDGVEFEGEAPKWVQREFIESIFKANSDIGKPLRPAELDLPLLIANDIPAVNVIGTFAPGKAPGLSVLKLQTTDNPAVSGGLVTDNWGARATGPYRVSGQLQMTGPMQMGDVIDLTALKTEGSITSQLGYTLPLGAQGANVTATFGQMNYTVVAPESAALNVAGKTKSHNVAFSLPVRRTRTSNINLSFSQGRTKLQNSVQGQAVSDYRVNKFGLGINADWRDEIFGGGATLLGMTLSTGLAKGTDNTGFFSRAFTKAQLTFAREQKLSSTSVARFNLISQYGPKGLDSSEGFSLGGPNAVRAYPSGEGSGPTGFVANFDITRAVRENLKLNAFYDFGRIYDRSSAGEPESYALSGIGAGLTWQSPIDWQFNLTLASRLGTNPNTIKTSTDTSKIGNDRDGSREINRIWFSMTKSF